MQTYLFIDVGYLRVLLKQASEVLQFPNPQSLRITNEMSYDSIIPSIERKFFYDAPPPRKRSDTDETYAGKLQHFEQMVSKVAKTSGWFVRTGYSRGLGRNARQKGVDIQIAVDMLTTSGAGNVNCLYLLSGDLDFKPVVDAVVSQGTKIVIWADESSTAEPLLRSADDFRKLTLGHLIQFHPDYVQSEHRVATGAKSSIHHHYPALETDRPLTSFMCLQSRRKVEIRKRAGQFDVTINGFETSIMTTDECFWQHENFDYLRNYIFADIRLLIPTAAALGI